jgi:HNH endonuclease
LAVRNLSDDIKAQVRARAKGLCEYCHAAEQWQYVEFTVDHVCPISKGGNDALINLALACFFCNRRKWNYLTALDPETGQDSPLFNPRQDVWQDHFIWSVDRIRVEGLTAIGRATIQALQFNRERALNLRSADVAIGRHPPSGDLIRKLPNR